VKIWIAWGSLVIGVIALAARPAAPEPPVRERRVVVPVRVEVPVEVSKIVEKVRVETRMIEKEVPAVPLASRPSETALAHEKMLFLFEREAVLRGDQRHFMEEVLAQRENEIAEVQRDIVRSGYFRARDYDLRIKAIQTASYEKMAVVLDEPQHRRFSSLVSEGRLGDAVVFEIPSSLVVIPD
jgi:hypothetical protein